MVEKLKIKDHLIKEMKEEIQKLKEQYKDHNKDSYYKEKAKKLEEENKMLHSE